MIKLNFSASVSMQVIAKGEAQGMVSKFLGIILGITLANYIGSSTSMALASFGAVTAAHMYCNIKSYQSIQLRTLNIYRASNFFVIPSFFWLFVNHFAAFAKLTPFPTACDHQCILYIM